MTRIAGARWAREIGDVPFADEVTVESIETYPYRALTLVRTEVE